MAENLTANQPNPFQYPGLTGNPETNIWDMIFRTPRWRGAQEEELFPTVDPLSADEMQRYGGAMMVSPERFEGLYGGMQDPGLREAILAQLEQVQSANRMRAAWYENWRQFTGDAYQQSADILSSMPRMY